MPSTDFSISSIWRSVLDEAIVERGDAVVEHVHRVVEAGADATDVNVDLGDLLPGLFLDPTLGGEQPVVEAVLGVVQLLRDRLADLGLEAPNGGVVVVDQLGERLEPGRDVGAQRLAELVLALASICCDTSLK